MMATDADCNGGESARTAPEATASHLGDVRALIREEIDAALHSQNPPQTPPPAIPRPPQLTGSSGELLACPKCNADRDLWCHVRVAQFGTAIAISLPQPQLVALPTSLARLAKPTAWPFLQQVPRYLNVFPLLQVATATILPSHKYLLP